MSGKGKKRKVPRCPGARPSPGDLKVAAIHLELIRKIKSAEKERVRMDRVVAKSIGKTMDILGITQVELARASGVSSHMIGMQLAGKKFDEYNARKMGSNMGDRQLSKRRVLVSERVISGYLKILGEIMERADDQERSVR